MTLDYDQDSITEFFAQTIQHHHNREEYMQKFSRSGFALIEKIPATAKILDVGCGKNLFKPWFPNLIGIDVIGTECDIQTSLLDYVTQDRYDVILCLGSVFGSLADIKHQIQHIKSLLVVGGKVYWRNHPAVPRHQFPPFFYPWCEATHRELAQQFGFDLNEVVQELSGASGYRIYAEWTLN